MPLTSGRVDQNGRAVHVFDSIGVAGTHRQPVPVGGLGSRLKRWYSVVSGRLLRLRDDCLLGEDRRLSPDEEREIQRELAELRQEHRDLDDAIAAMAGAPIADTMGLQRLKKRKLALKDRIAKLEDRLLPDIIA